MVMEWEEKEGKVYCLKDSSELGENGIEELENLDSVESVNEEYTSHTTGGVSSYLRITLNEKVKLSEEFPKELTDLVPASNLARISDPAELMGYKGMLDKLKLRVEEPLSEDEISGIEDHLLTVYVQDISLEEDPLYAIGVTESGAKNRESLEESLRSIRSDIRLLDFSDITIM